MPARTVPQSSSANLNLEPPPPAFLAQFGALPESIEMSPTRSVRHGSVHSSDRLSTSSSSDHGSEPMQRQHRPNFSNDADRIQNVSSFKEEVKLRLAWLDDEIKLLELRERWWNSRFSDRSRRKRERKKVDELERDLRQKWDHIFFVTRYKEMSKLYSKDGLMEEYERLERADDILENPSGADRRSLTPRIV